MIKLLKIKPFKKCVFSNTFKWKNFGLYYSLPISYKYKLKYPELKLSSRFRGYYYEKVVEDNIYSYSSAFQKDSFERLKTISMLKKHRRKLWINDRNEYLPYTLCDMLRISYKDNNVLRFVVRYKIINTCFWMLNFFPRKNYKLLISNILKKQNLLNFFYKISKFINKKLYSFFYSKYLALSKKKERIFLLKIIWKSAKFVFLTASGYRFIRTGLYWMNLGIFTGLFYIIKGDAKLSVVRILVLTYIMFIYYNNLFLWNIKNIDTYFNLLLYAKYQEFFLYLLEFTYETQKIKFRRSNRVLTRWHHVYIKTFKKIQHKFFTYFKINYFSAFQNKTCISNYFLYSTYFEYLHDFENSVDKDRKKLFFIDNYTIDEKILIFKTIIYLMQFDLYRGKVKYWTMINFYYYFNKKSDIFYSIISILKINFFVFNRFSLKGFMLNNFISRIYLNLPLSRRKIFKNFFFSGYKKKVLFWRKNYFKHKKISVTRFKVKRHYLYIMFRSYILKRICKLFFYKKKINYFLRKPHKIKYMIIFKNIINNNNKVSKINIK